MTISNLLGGSMTSWKWPDASIGSYSHGNVRTRSAARVFEADLVGPQRSADKRQLSRRWYSRTLPRVDGVHHGENGPPGIASLRSGYASNFADRSPHGDLRHHRRH